MLVVFLIKYEYIIDVMVLHNHADIMTKCLKGPDYRMKCDAIANAYKS